ncbi:D-tyrosyl-tRNA(Tyr) deacylase [Lewinellaceae bacterium SD302]|nr:D-tyrosyl-tRNA(Tyr) deacylase [Lewinellaceae bacterium SD302]
MRVLIQRVSEASVAIEGEPTRAIGPGLLVLLGIEEADETADIEWLCGKISRLRIFGDEDGNMNKSVTDIGGELMVISQFTLFSSTKKGNRPGFTRAARPDVAVPLYEQFVKRLRFDSGTEVKTGTFGADMKVGLVNDGPVTIWIDSKDRE